MALVAIAFMIPARVVGAKCGSIPPPWLVGGIALLAGSLFLVLPREWGWGAMAAYLALDLAVIAAVSLWSKRAGWGPLHRLALAGGATLAYGWHSFMQGTADPLVPFEGGALGKNGERGQILSHQAAVEKWVDLDHCATPPKKEQSADNMGDGTSIGTAIYAACVAGTEVRGYTIVDGGHTWPGGWQYLPVGIIGKTTENLDASEVIWEFFSRHSH